MGDYFKNKDILDQNDQFSGVSEQTKSGQNWEKGAPIIFVTK